MKAKLSNRVAAWSTLPTASLHGKIVELQRSGEDIIDLTIGISNRPIPKPGAQAAIAAITANDVPYTAIGGDSQLKAALRRKLVRDNSIAAEDKNLIVVTGAKQAIFEALYTLTNPGDEVLLFQPYWPAYTQIATMLKLTPRFMQLSDIASLSAKHAVEAKSRVLILNNPHNPSGKLFSREELMTIADFARQNDLYVLSDESYEKLVYEGDYINFRSIAPDMEDRTVTVFSISQSFSMMGWRLGYAVANADIIQAMEAVQSSITASTSAVTQTAVASIVNTSNDYVTALVDDFRRRRDAVYPTLAGISGMRCELPASGPYFWCNIEEITTDSLSFCSQLLERERVAIMPGEAFGAPGWVRIAFNVQPVEVLKTAAKRLAAFCQA